MKVPNFKDPEVTKFLIEMDRAIAADRRKYLDRYTANHSVLLLSPSKKTYEITISDAGALVATLVQG